jgi:hypothetical protein
MKLKSFGCSFIFGTDLSDDGSNLKYATPSKLTWPSLVAQQQNLDYRCYARPGSGNLQILERLLSQLADPEPAIYVVGWTWIDRFDYWTDQVTWAGTHWKTVMPIDQDDRAKNYYRDLHSQYRDKLTTLVFVKNAIDALIQHKQKFFMTYMDYLMFETEWHTTPAVIELQNSIKPYMKDFDGKNFLDWSRDRGYAISDTSHPLEQAHAEASKHMITVFDKQKTNDPAQQVLF